jgi:hypothetical protein
MTMKRFNLTMAILSTLTLGACVGEIGGTDDDMDGDGSGSDMPPVTCEAARTYTGFGGPLETDRPTIEPGSDRMRVKPFGVLASEYNRALAITGFNTTAYAATFGKPPARWYQEPLASANTIFAAYSLAFSGCKQKTATGADFAMAPSPTVADRLCRDFVRTAWSREATDAEATTCATFAVSQTDASDDTRKRWAYTCAAVLTASGFLAY